ncbi:MAG: hypothetical protein CO144_01305 [Candidatus Nealsonbacteria bacterium CG_4_9_14_3_um_filter_35_11]|nr:MAG: hypothetical protein CO144_01305 [Candidatus Nealsonbacteria bacterium CG_4_9_14_3_um_filter_35_11]
MEEDITFFGRTTFRRELRKFGIKTDDRRRHLYAIGKTGMGKTEMLKNMAIQDIQKGEGVGFVDPHGEAASGLLDFVPQARIKDVVYFNPADLNYPIAFNIMEEVSPENRHLVAGGLMGVFKKIWPDVWSARMEYILNNSILALLEIPGSTLLAINRLLADPDFREKVVERIKDPVIKSFWLKEFARYTQRYEVEATAAIQNKIGQLISAPLIRNIIGQTHSTIDMRKIMDEKKILIMDLSKGRIGEDCSRLLGALLITKLQLAAMSRVDIPEQKREDFFLYVDEFQNFATESFVNVLSEARKYRLSLTLGHQYISQMEEEVRDAVFGNVGTMAIFRVGAEDAEFLEKEFSPEFSAQDLVNLPKYNIYVKLMIDGVASRPFSAATIEPFKLPEKSYTKEITEFSRQAYSTSKEIVEEKIAENTGLADIPGIGQRPPELYDAKCQICGKWTKVPFRPDSKRPIFCKACLKRIEKERQEAQLSGHKKTFESLPGISLKEATQTSPISFSPQKNRKELEEEQTRRQKEKEKEKKEIDIKVLKELLEDIDEKSKRKPKKEKKKGKIEPGQTIKF